jgi:hypothetical protein
LALGVPLAQAQMAALAIILYLALLLLLAVAVVALIKPQGQMAVLEAVAVHFNLLAQMLEETATLHLFLRLKATMAAQAAHMLPIT